MKTCFLNLYFYHALCKGAVIRAAGFIACMLLAICAFANSADAHKVNIFAYVQDGKVHAEGYFADGSKCRNSVIEVVDDKTGKKLLEGNTDDNGQYSFDIPHATALKLILYAGLGHQNEYVLSEEEVRAGLPLSKKMTDKKTGQVNIAAHEPKLIKREDVPGVQATINQPAPAEDMEALVGKVVDSKLEPVMRILVKLQEQSEKPGLTEIVGGIGYIIGIIGIIGYFKGRAAGRNTQSQ